MTETAGVTGPHRPKAELRALTGLRAIAALAVVVSHAGVPPSAPLPIREMASWGYVGVPLFFVLSGFVLAYNYPDLTVRDGPQTLRFYVARIARVMPLYWLMILYCVVIHRIKGDPQYPRAFVLDIFGLQSWGGDLDTAVGRYNGPGWSICVEVFFYALFPLLIPVVAWLARRYGRTGMVVLIGAAAIASCALCAWFVATGRADLSAADPASAHRWLYRNPLTRLIEFVSGIAAAFLLQDTGRIRVGWHHLVQAVVVAYAVALAAFHPQHSNAFGAASFSALWVIPFVVLLLSLASGRGWFARFLSLGALVRLGAASYALYITHRWMLYEMASTTRISTGNGWDPYLALLAVLALVLVIGEGAHQYIEVPCRVMILRWSRRIGRRQPRVGSTDQPSVTTTGGDDESDKSLVLNR